MSMAGETQKETIYADFHKFHLQPQFVNPGIEREAGTLLPCEPGMLVMRKLIRGNFIGNIYSRMSAVVAS
jgi:hypothetical protein